MRPIIRYYVRHIYGVPRIYLADTEQAKAIATLTRRKTVEEVDLKALETLGFVLVEVLDSSASPRSPSFR